LDGFVDFCWYVSCAKGIKKNKKYFFVSEVLVKDSVFCYPFYLKIGTVAISLLCFFCGIFLNTVNFFNGRIEILEIFGVGVFFGVYAVRSLFYRVRVDNEGFEIRSVCIKKYKFSDIDKIIINKKAGVRLLVIFKKGGSVTISGLLVNFQYLVSVFQERYTHD